MFERYTESARRVLFFARYEASEFGSSGLGTEHVLLGLLREGKGLVPRILAQFRVSPESIRKDVEQRLGSGDAIPTNVEIPFSADAQQALMHAAQAADSLRHDYIGSEHLLLGLLRTDGCVAASILTARGLRADDVAASIAGLTTSSPCDSARVFVRELGQLAERLADHNLVVSSLHCDWRSFGSWSLEAQRDDAAIAYGDALLAGRFDVDGPEVIAAIWDGKERILTVQTAPTPALSSPGPWRQLATIACADGKAAIEAAEEYMRKWSVRS